MSATEVISDKWKLAAPLLDPDFDLFALRGKPGVEGALTRSLELNVYALFDSTWLRATARAYIYNKDTTKHLMAKSERDAGRDAVVLLNSRFLLDTCRSSTPTCLIGGGGGGGGGGTDSSPMMLLHDADNKTALESSPNRPLVIVSLRLRPNAEAHFARQLWSPELPLGASALRLGHHDIAAQGAVPDAALTPHQRRQRADLCAALGDEIGTRRFSRLMSGYPTSLALLAAQCRERMRPNGTKPTNVRTSELVWLCAAAQARSFELFIEVSHLGTCGDLLAFPHLRALRLPCQRLPDSVRRAVAPPSLSSIQALVGSICSNRTAERDAPEQVAGESQTQRIEMDLDEPIVTSADQPLGVEQGRGAGEQEEAAADASVDVEEEMIGFLPLPVPTRPLRRGASDLSRGVERVDIDDGGGGESMLDTLTLGDIGACSAYEFRCYGMARLEALFERKRRGGGSGREQALPYEGGSIPHPERIKTLFGEAGLYRRRLFEPIGLFVLCCVSVAATNLRLSLLELEANQCGAGVSTETHCASINRLWAKLPAEGFGKRAAESTDVTDRAFSTILGALSARWEALLRK